MKQFLKKPLVSEKSFSFISQGKYSFIATTEIDKTSAKEIIEKLYKVTVVKINIQSIAGKIKKARGVIGVRNNFKKVTATLKKGDKIALFESEKDPKKVEDSKDVKTTVRTKADKTSKTKKETKESN